MQCRSPQVSDIFWSDLVDARLIKQAGVICFPISGIIAVEGCMS